MLIKMKTRKAIASNWLVLAFLLLLLVSAAISEFFQAPTSPSQELSKYTALFNPEEMQLIRAITINNKLGAYRLERSEPYEQNRWLLTTPRRLDANAQTISLIFETLKNINIKKVFDKDPINLASFSLNSPVMTIELETLGSDAKSLLEVGLINPIDNSTYLTFKGQEAIFQTEALQYPLETFDLGQFINTNLFLEADSTLSSIALYRGKNNGSPIFNLEFKDDNWLLAGRNDVNQEAVQEFIDVLRKSKGQIILDTLNDKQEPLVTKLIQQPLYSLVVKENGQEYVFSITAPINTIPGLKVEKGQSIIISSAQKSYPIVASKDLLNFFSKQFNFRSLPVKKLFY